MFSDWLPSLQPIADWLTVAMFAVAGVAAFAGLIETIVLAVRGVRRAVVRLRLWRLRHLLSKGDVP